MNKEKLILKVTMLASAMLANDSTYRSSFSKTGATATQTFPALTIVCCISWWISLLQVNIKDTTKTMILSAALGLREKMWKNQRGTFCLGIPNYVRISIPYMLTLLDTAKISRSTSHQISQIQLNFDLLFLLAHLPKKSKISFFGSVSVPVLQVFHQWQETIM